MKQSNLFLHFVVVPRLAYVAPCTDKDKDAGMQASLSCPRTHGMVEEGRAAPAVMFEGSILNCNALLQWLIATLNHKLEPTRYISCKHCIYHKKMPT